MSRSSGRVITGGGPGVTDHGGLTGLSDDDHSIYALADGSRGSFAATTHTHAAGDIASGTIATARLGSGTANNTKFLRGDQAWEVPPAPSLGLDDLSDVAITSASTGATLIYTGTSWIDGQLDLADSDARTGTLPIGSGGTGQITAAAAFDALAPTTTRGDLVRRGASGNERVGLGTSGYVLGSNGTDATWLRNTRVLHYDVGATVANTTTETTMLASAPTVPGGLLQAGDVLWVFAGGTCTNSSGGNRTIVMQWGPDDVFSPTFTSNNIATGTTSRLWSMSLKIGIYLTGVRGTAIQYYEGTFGISGTGGANTWDGVSAATYDYVISAGAQFGTTLDYVHDMRIAMSNADFTVDTTWYQLIYIPKTV